MGRNTLIVLTCACHFILWMGFPAAFSADSLSMYHLSVCHTQTLEPIARLRRLTRSLAKYSIFHDVTIFASRRLAMIRHIESIQPNTVVTRGPMARWHDETALIASRLQTLHTSQGEAIRSSGRHHTARNVTETIKSKHHVRRPTMSGHSEGGVRGDPPTR